MSGRPQDSWGKKAKKEGFAARAVFKLSDIDRRTNLLRPNMSVLDLGASPGSWSEYACLKVGKGGLVVAVDEQPLRIPERPNLVHLVKDVYAPELESEVCLLRDYYDVVLSDMAPWTTGNRTADQARSYRLFERALDIASVVLRPGGHFVGKIFQGPDFEIARTRVRLSFEEHKIVKPPASRNESMETFLVGLRFKRPPGT